MYKLFIHCLAILFGISLLPSGSWAADKEVVLKNAHYERIISIQDNHISTKSIKNLLSNQTLAFKSSEEFCLRISGGTHTTDTDAEILTKDCVVTAIEDQAGRAVITLRNDQHQLTLQLIYTLEANDFFARKQLLITPDKDIVLEHIDLERINSEEPLQFYQIDAINARGKWSPGIGQPIYSLKSAIFLGVEFPASRNVAENNIIHCGYYWGKTIPAKTTYTTYPSVIGVADDGRYLAEAFQRYIDGIRIRPFRLQVQYNTWFDYGGGVSQEKFNESVATIHQQLVTERGCDPLAAYVLDDGWQDSKGKKSDWSKGFWPVNEKFDTDFSRALQSTSAAQSHLGLWFSMGCFFGSKSMVPVLREKGYEALELSMSMAGPKYMQGIEDRMLALTKLGVTYFKCDGTFGHLHIRDFELQPDRGSPVMPQLETAGLVANDAKLNDAKFTELKLYYLSAGTERMIEIFKKMHAINPQVYIAITNGAYLSPWWLQYIDTVWQINAGDAAGGSSRTDELVYRDGVYYEFSVKERAQFPLNSIFNHEPKKTKTGESAEVFRDYLFMHMSRGSGFIELYIKPKILSASDWDILAEGLKWSKHMFTAFRSVVMHGGNPKERVVYGYTGWGDKLGYVSAHNPSKEEKTYSFILNRDFGIPAIHHDSTWQSVLITGKLPQEIAPAYKYGDTVTWHLAPGEVRIIELKK